MQREDEARGGALARDGGGSIGAKVFGVASGAFAVGGALGWLVGCGGSGRPLAVFAGCAIVLVGVFVAIGCTLSLGLALDGAALEPPWAKAKRAAGSKAFPAYRDRVSKKCAIVQERFRLSRRESQVAELMARGETVPRIAAALTISENTVRMHGKHIYAKLGIHKRDELYDLIDQVDEEAPLAEGSREEGQGSAG